MISVNGGEYRVNTGPFTSAPGFVVAGNTVEVRHLSAAGFSATTNSTVTIGGVSDTFSSTTEARDDVPNAFSFSDQSGVTINTVVTSSPITVAGINGPSTISVVGGSYSINGGAFTSAAGSVVAGDAVIVRHTSASGFLATTNTTLVIGGVSDTFTSTTEPLDDVPGAFSFNGQSGVTINTVVTSSPITVAGINGPSPISITGGSYSINGGTYTSAAGSVVAGDVVVLRHTSAAGFLASTNTTLVIGGVSDTFTSTTEAMDTTPNAFGFVDQGGLATNAVATSAPITITGINVASPISITGGSYSINGGAFSSAAGSVSAGDQVRVRVTSAATSATAVNAVVTIGGVSDTFSATTGSVDSTPGSFAFADVTGAKRNKAVVSSTITVAGINTAVAISVSGGGSVKYSKNGAAFTASPGTVVNGDQIRLQLTASASANTLIDAIATIGGISDTWSVTSGSH